MESTFDANGVRRMRVERRGGEVHKTYFLDAWSEVEDGKLARFIVHGGKRIARLASDSAVPAAGLANARMKRRTDHARRFRACWSGSR